MALAAISRDEFMEAMRSHPELPKERVEHLFKTLDFTGTGQVEYGEFIAATLASQKTSQSATSASLFAAFNTLDVDHDGYISKEDLHKAFSGNLDDDVAESLLRHRDASGRVNYESFQRSIVGLLGEDHERASKAHDMINTLSPTSAHHQHHYKKHAKPKPTEEKV